MLKKLATMALLLATPACAEQTYGNNPFPAGFSGIHSGAQSRGAGQTWTYTNPRRALDRAITMRRHGHTARVMAHEDPRGVVTSYTVSSRSRASVAASSDDEVMVFTTNGWTITTAAGADIWGQ